jgi:CheY-like chemotaxis protein
MSDSRPVVAILNNIEDLVRMFSEVLRGAGYEVVTAMLADARRGKQDLVAFIKETDPRVIVYDVSFPYAINWTQLEGLRDRGALLGRGVLVTTPNRRAMQDLLKVGDVLEITGRPEEISNLVEQVGQLVKEPRFPRELETTAPPPTS